MKDLDRASDLAAAARSLSEALDALEGALDRLALQKTDEADPKALAEQASAELGAAVEGLCGAARRAAP